VIHQVLLCVANKSDLLSEEDREQKREKWMNWCLDHGLELIECSVTQDKIEGNRDAEGLERVVESIGNHTWSGYEMKGKDTQGSEGGGSTQVPAVQKILAQSLDSSAPLPPSSAAIDYSKWDKLAAEESEGLENSRAESLPSSQAAESLERIVATAEKKKAQELAAAPLEPLTLDEETERWFKANSPTEKEMQLVQEMKEILAEQDISLDNFFMDSSLLKKVETGPNAAVHVNHDKVLPTVGKLLLRIHQVIKETPSLSRLGVRYRIWSEMVDQKGSMESLLPLALLWCMLESCAAEGLFEFFKRVSVQKEVLREWVDNTVVPTALKCTDPTVSRLDYVRQILQGAEEHKVEGNSLFKGAKFKEAINAYSIAIRMLEQFYTGDKHILQAAKDVTVACHLNIAACALKLPGPGMVERATQECTYALALDKSNPKAFYRRALSFLRTTDPAVNSGQGKETEIEAELFPEQNKKPEESPPRNVLVAWAIRDLEQALELAPGDKAIKTELEKAKKEAREAVKKKVLQDKTPTEHTGQVALDDGSGEDQMSKVLEMMRFSLLCPSSVPVFVSHMRGVQGLAPMRSGAPEKS